MRSAGNTGIMLYDDINMTWIEVHSMHQILLWVQVGGLPSYVPKKNGWAGSPDLCPSCTSPLRVRFTGSCGNMGSPLRPKVGFTVFEDEAAFNDSKKNGISMKMCGLPGRLRRFIVYFILSKRCGRIALASLNTRRKESVCSKVWGRKCAKFLLKLCIASALTGGGFTQRAISRSVKLFRG